MEATQVKPETTVAPPEGPGKKSPQLTPPKKKRKWVKRLVILLVIAALLVLALSRCMSAGTQALSSVYLPYTAAMHDMTVAVSGTGTIEPIQSYKVTTLVSGEILEAPFEEGQTVHKGDVLFRIDASDVENNIEQLQLNVQSAQLALNDLLKTQSDNQKDRNVKADDAGVITELHVDRGDSVTVGTVIADVLDRDHMKLKVPFHSADASGFYVGQAATVTVNGTAETVSGTVESIAATDEVGPGGTLVRQVTILVNNPGVLSETSQGTASVGGAACASGSSFTYASSSQITAKAAGDLDVLNVKEGDRVSKGQVIGVISEADLETQIENARIALENAQLSLKNAQEKLEEATKELEKYNAVAPIDGTVLQCSLTEGQEVSSGQGITIADTSQMIIEIQVDERNARYIKAGMMVDINQYGTPYVGIVESVSMTASGENGVASIPAVVTVDNYDGSMIPGTYAEYSFVASESEDCLTVPVQAVKYVSFANVQLPETLDADPSAGMDDGMMDDGMMDDGMMDDGMMDDGMMDGGMVDGGVEALPQSYSGGAFADPLGMIAVPMPGGGVVVDGGSMGGSSGGASDDSTGVIVWVKSKEAPANAILEPDPTWDCPESFWAVPVEVGLSDNSKVEITRGLAEGQEVFIGYQNPDEMYY